MSPRQNSPFTPLPRSASSCILSPNVMDGLLAGLTTPPISSFQFSPSYSVPSFSALTQRPSLTSDVPTTQSERPTTNSTISRPSCPPRSQSTTTISGLGLRLPTSASNSTITPTKSRDQRLASLTHSEADSISSQYSTGSPHISSSSEEDGESMFSSAGSSSSAGAGDSSYPATMTSSNLQAVDVNFPFSPSSIYSQTTMATPLSKGTFMDTPHIPLSPLLFASDYHPPTAQLALPTRYLRRTSNPATLSLLPPSARRDSKPSVETMFNGDGWEGLCFSEDEADMRPRRASESPRGALVEMKKEERFLVQQRAYYGHQRRSQDGGEDLTDELGDEPNGSYRTDRSASLASTTSLVNPERLRTQHHRSHEVLATQPITSQLSSNSSSDEDDHVLQSRHRPTTKSTLPSFLSLSSLRRPSRTDFLAATQIPTSASWTTFGRRRSSTPVPVEGQQRRASTDSFRERERVRRLNAMGELNRRESEVLLVQREEEVELTGEPVSRNPVGSAEVYGVSHWSPSTIDSSSPSCSSSCNTDDDNEHEDDDDMHQDNNSSPKSQHATTCLIPTSFSPESPSMVDSPVSISSVVSAPPNPSFSPPKTSVTSTFSLSTFTFPFETSSTSPLLSSLSPSTFLSATSLSPSSPSSPSTFRATTAFSDESDADWLAEQETLSQLAGSRELHLGRQKEAEEEDMTYLGECIKMAFTPPMEQIKGESLEREDLGSHPTAIYAAKAFQRQPAPTLTASTTPVAAPKRKISFAALPRLNHTESSPSVHITPTSTLSKPLHKTKSVPLFTSVPVPSRTAITTTLGSGRPYDRLASFLSSSPLNARVCTPPPLIARPNSTPSGVGAGEGGGGGTIPTARRMSSFNRPVAWGAQAGGATSARNSVVVVPIVVPELKSAQQPDLERPKHISTSSSTTGSSTATTTTMTVTDAASSSTSLPRSTSFSTLNQRLPFEATFLARAQDKRNSTASTSSFSSPMTAGEKKDLKKKKKEKKEKEEEDQPPPVPPKDIITPTRPLTHPIAPNTGVSRSNPILATKRALDLATIRPIKMTNPIVLGPTTTNTTTTITSPIHPTLISKQTSSSPSSSSSSACISSSSSSSSSSIPSSSSRPVSTPPSSTLLTQGSTAVEPPARVRFSLPAKSAPPLPNNPSMNITTTGPISSRQPPLFLPQEDDGWEVVDVTVGKERDGGVGSDHDSLGGGGSGGAGGGKKMGVVSAGLKGMWSRKLGKVALSK